MKKNGVYLFFVSSHLQVFSGTKRGAKTRKRVHFRGPMFGHCASEPSKRAHVDRKRGPFRFLEEAESQPVRTRHVDVHDDERPPVVCCNQAPSVPPMERSLHTSLACSPVLNSRATSRYQCCSGSRVNPLCVNWTNSVLRNCSLFIFVRGILWRSTVVPCVTHEESTCTFT